MRNTHVDDVLESGSPIEFSVRILSTDLVWPEGNPPFPSGDYVSVPELPEPVLPYTETAYLSDPDTWYYIDHLIESWTTNSTLESQINSLSLSTKSNLEEKMLRKLFKPNKVIRLQYILDSGEVTPGTWTDIGWFLSTGCNIQLDANGSTWTINALGILQLANLDILPNITLGPQILRHGTFATKHTLSLVAKTDDYYSYGITSGPAGQLVTIIEDAPNWKITTTVDALIDDKLLEGMPIYIVDNNERYHSLVISTTPDIVVSKFYTDAHVEYEPLEDDYFYIGAVHPNWAEKPAPQVWVTGVPTWNFDVPLAIAADATQVVFGSGILRLGLNYILSSPMSNDSDRLDFTFGLGFGAGVVPNLEGVIYRYAHMTGTDVNGNTYYPDSLYGVEVDSTELGEIVLVETGSIEQQLYLLPQNTSIYIRATDGSLQEYAIAEISGLVLTLADIYANIPAGTILDICPSGFLPTIVEELMVWSGFQSIDNSLPLYVGARETPHVGGSDVEICISPQRIEQDSKTTPYGALGLLKQNGFIPPIYQVRETSDGSLKQTNITQLAKTNPAAIPIPTSIDFNHDNSDLNVFSRVIGKGNRPQVEDYIQTKLSSIVNVASGDGGLLNVTAHVVDDLSITLTDNYLVGTSLVNQLSDRHKPISIVGSAMRPWWWYYTDTATSATYKDIKDLANSWCERVLCQIQLTSAQEIGSIELHTNNSWYVDDKDYPGANYNTSIVLTPKSVFSHTQDQILTMEYLDEVMDIWRPLVSNIKCNTQLLDVHEIQYSDFDLGLPVTAQYLRLVCNQPFVGEWGPECSAVIAVYLSRLYINSLPTLQSEAEIGVTAPFDTSDWQTVAYNFRRRTTIIPTCFWSDTQELLDALVLDHLKFSSTDMNVKSLSVFRPDVEVGDTIVYTEPGGVERAYLVVGRDINNELVSQLKVTDYTELYLEDPT